MSISSVVVVADNQGIDTTGVEFAFVPGGGYPAEAVMTLTVSRPPWPPQTPSLLDRLRGAAYGPPDYVVPAITTVKISYGTFVEGTSPPPIDPAEHWIRELKFDAWYVRDSWQIQHGIPQVTIGVTAGLRDNSPSGDEPDDPFIAFMDAQALCIWTRESVGLGTILPRGMRNFRK